MRTLDELERWFQGEITSPHEARTRKNADKHGAARERVRPSRQLTPEQRVAIYSEMYFSRLYEVLGEEFPSTRQLCGPVEFERLVRAYLREHPSRNYSLNPLGRKLPEFLAGPFKIPKKALLYDVARLENSISIVFEAAPSTLLRPEDVAKIPADAWDKARPRLIDALELHSFEHRANDIVRALRKGEELPSLARRRTQTVVWRKEWVVWRANVDEPMFAVLKALREGRTLTEAIESGARHFHGAAEELQARISRSFGEWISDGLFARVDLE